MTDVVVTEIKDGIATVTMNRPKALNALNIELTQGLREAILPLEFDTSVRCVVIRGGEHFMAGGDLKWFSELLGGEAAAKRVLFEDFINNVHPIIVAIRRMPKPVVASVSGAAAGFGLSLVLATDLTIAADDAYFTLAYTLIGTTPDGGSTFSLPRLVGMKKAMEIALLGDRFDAATAARLGLINWIVPAAELEGSTADLATRLANGPTAVYGRTKALLQQSPDTSLHDQLQAEAEAFAQSASEANFKEGITAFLEKRRAKFEG